MNTHPNTPFGHFFVKLGVWKPSFEEGVIALYDKLHGYEKDAVHLSSGWLAVISANLTAVPDFVFVEIQKRFPEATKEAVTDFVNKLNARIAGIDSQVPDDFATAMTKLQEYLLKYNGNTWINIIRMVVTEGADILLNGVTPIDAISAVLAYVYHTFIKKD
jgi:hypothetical protein